MTTTPAKPHRVVIVGAGFGGLETAFGLKGAAVEITLDLVFPNTDDVPARGFKGCCVPQVARDVALENVTFIDGSAVEPLACQARLRYHTPPIPAVYVGGRLQLGEPFLGAAPGQAAVLYAGSRVLGGGIISAAA